MVLRPLALGLMLFSEFDFVASSLLPSSLKFCSQLIACAALRTLRITTKWGDVIFIVQSLVRNNRPGSTTAKDFFGFGSESNTFFSRLAFVGDTSCYKELVTQMSC